MKAVRWIPLWRELGVDWPGVIGGIVRASGLKWTIAPVAPLTNGPKTASVRAGYIGAGGVRLARADTVRQQ